MTELWGLEDNVSGDGDPFLAEVEVLPGFALPALLWRTSSGFSMDKFKLLNLYKLRHIKGHSYEA